MEKVSWSMLHMDNKPWLLHMDNKAFTTRLQHI